MYFAGITQLVEYLTRNEEVEGSSPFSSSKKPVAVATGFLFAYLILKVMTKSCTHMIFFKDCYHFLYYLKIVFDCFILILIISYLFYFYNSFFWCMIKICFVL